MTEREALTLLIRDKGRCNHPLKNPHTLMGVWCNAPCPFHHSEFECLNPDMIYKRAVELYLIKYGKENLVEDLI